ncbi:hypothetical protein [Pseudoalteromonas piscicida]|uniref:Uncharacterized protein n=1 Tax=Pseudoalteromonas piscicida TaxID=43662 RepID=A0A2A5JJY3_PSEO7|nr:hypothetical protein [Pseudoalteromonas piscicida]PCK29521.1 hypothetical protein CEX98_22600 [Pseudoalteromonas piscicida]
MTILTQPIELEHVKVKNTRVFIQCQCCKHKELANQGNITPLEWRNAALVVGWRHVMTEYTDIDVVCPSCVEAFHTPIQQPKREAV